MLMSNKWKNLPSLTLYAQKEAMIHISPDILRSGLFVPSLQTLSATGRKGNCELETRRHEFPYIASFLALAPNIEILHVTACVSDSELVSPAKFVIEVLDDKVSAYAVPLRIFSCERCSHLRL